MSEACEWEKRCRWIVDHISYRAVKKLLGPPYDVEPLPLMSQDELIAVIDRCRATIDLVGDEWEQSR